MNFATDNFLINFEIGNKLGHGHFAEVKYCKHKTNLTEYAAKFIRRRQLLDEKHIGMNIEDIEREANILTMLNHPNVIKLFFCYDLGKNIVLVLELVSGGELFDHISDSEKLSEEEASEFVEQIVLGLHHMHDRNIVHLDLKPENVMIENLIERKIKLIDFGLAREIKNRNTVIEMQGTAEFLAPEVIEYNPISYATDMWAIGVITYIMLTGVSPFSGDDQISTFQNIVNCRLEYDEEICSEMSEMAKSFINSLLVLDARKRATAADCLIHPWIKPMEPAIMFRRRSSIISRDKLKSLKHFVVSPSPPSSEEPTPHMHRKCSINDDFLEDVEESPSDDDVDRLSSLRKNSSKEIIDCEPSETMQSEATSSIFKNTNGSHEPLPKDVDVQKNEPKQNLNGKPVSESDTPNTSAVHNPDSKQCRASDEPCTDSEIIPGKDNLNGECNYVSKKVTVATEKVNNQKFNNAISNSVRRFSTKIESITSFFDSKHKNTAPPRGRGSLKNLFTVNNDSLFTNLPKSSSNAPSSALFGQRSPHYVKEAMFTMAPASASVATSPTVMKKSMFFNRYVTALETKKK